jgi:hypothetical protein
MERGRAVGLASAVLLAVPLLFAAVWTREEVSRELRTRDELYARRDSLEHSVLRLSSSRSRMLQWDQIEARLGRTGLRPPRREDVLWVRVDGGVLGGG